MKRFRIITGLCMALAGVCAVAPVKNVCATEVGSEVEKYNVKFDLKNISIAEGGEATAVQGEQYYVSFAADDGYTLPEDVTVQVKFNDESLEMTDYIYEDGNLTIGDVYGDITIKAEGQIIDSGSNSGSSSGSSSQKYSIWYDTEHVKVSKQPGVVTAGTAYSVKITPKKGYKLSGSDVEVMCNDEYIYDGYDFSNNILTIYSVDGDIIIEALARKASASKNNSSNASSDDNKKNPTVSSDKTSNTSSKSQQALNVSGKKPSNYTGSSYVAPKTGDEGIDIRFAGAFALVFAGISLLVFGRKNKLVKE
ncbi:MAG: hypothetical protein II243_02035 [Lachnospiraceae bacterium]|nr:hypothetical protein [Lachnospiraceae bacterium]